VIRVGILLWLLAFSSSGAVFRVNQHNDSIYPSSLRGAIIAANSAASYNVIVLGEGVYKLSISGADEDHAARGDLDITGGSLTLLGQGSNTIIDATGLGDRVFHIFPTAKVTMVGVVIKGGLALSVYAQLSDGGAIYNAGTLSLKNCIISGNASFQASDLLDVVGGHGAGIYNEGSLSMSGCIVRENFSGRGNPGGNGGGIYNPGIATIRKTKFISNSAGNADSTFSGAWGGNGGGIFNGGTMLLTECTLSENVSGSGSDGRLRWELGLPVSAEAGGPGGNGAGIFNQGNLKLSSCTLDHNVAGRAGNGSDTAPLRASGGIGGSGGSGGSGAGLFNSGTAILETCTISENRCGKGGAGGLGVPQGGAGGAGGNGAGIYNVNVLKLTSCTVSSNFCGAGGAGGPGTLTWFTQSPNAAGGRGGDGGTGGGIYNAENGATAELGNSLIGFNFAALGGAGGAAFPPNSIPGAGSPGTPGDAPCLCGAFNSQGFNLVSDSSGSLGFTNGVGNDLVGNSDFPIDAHLGPLQNNGGFTQTHALLPDSPAIDQGVDFGALFDQRGHRRSQDDLSIVNQPGGTGADIGSFEADVRSGRKSN
jgi:hypothetical protein